MPSKGKLVSLTLVAIILPISLLATFKLTGILQEPQEPETITQNTVYWSMEKPSALVTVGQEFKNEYSTDEISTEIGVHVQEYWENGSTLPFGGRDGVSFETSANISVHKGFGASLTIEFDVAEGNSDIYVGKHLFLQPYNVSIDRIGSNYDEAYLEARIFGSPSSIQVQSHWAFNNDAPEDQTLNATLEVLYFNGISYRKVILPMQLHMWADAGDNFESAKQISLGNYTGFVGTGLGPPWSDDLEDYYKLWVEQGTTIRVQMTHQTNINFDLYLYGPDEGLLASSSLPKPNTTEVVTQMIEVSGWYYVRVKAVLGFGIYTLEITS